MRALICCVLILSMTSCSYDRLMMMSQKKKASLSPLEQVTLQELVERYMAKDQSSVGTIEGIYTVSSVVTKKGKAILSSREKEKVTDRQENYTKVAIIRDNSAAGREFIEIVIEKDHLTSYPVFGEFSTMAESNLLLYKHFDSKGRSSSFTFTYDKIKDVLEGVRTDNSNNKTITYKLTYIKMFPKVGIQPSSSAR
ncbi:MAG TPA: hypothetical protein VFE50_00270 [Cyclobacteriaceae bacterium]|nr:hypothetical protein [Cyclobacteriaceae bacterium]